MSFLDIRTTTRKNGQQSAWFKDTLGRRVGTRMGLSGDRGAITNAQQMSWLAAYYIELQQEQLDAGLGSDGSPMPPLKTGGQRKFVRRRNGVAEFRTVGTLRRLYGPGIGGHMRDDIRINYVDDRMAKISITRQGSRIKAFANERRAAWWGLGPASSRKFASAQATIYGGAMEDYLDRIGLVQAGNYITQLARVLNAKKRTLAA